MIHAARPPFASLALLVAFAAAPAWAADTVGQAATQLARATTGESQALARARAFLDRALNGNGAPSLAAIPVTAEVTVGGLLQIPLDGTDPNGDVLSFTASPLPLPAGASIQPTSGVFSFAPGPAVVGDHALSFRASDGALTSTPVSTTITVLGAAPGGTTALQGLLLDANDAAAGTTTPLVGATITNVETGASTTSADDGTFHLEGISTGPSHFLYDGTALGYAGYTGAKDIVANVTNVLARPIYLMRIDAGGVGNVVAGEPTTVENEALGVTLQIAADAAVAPGGGAYTGPVSVSEVPVGFTPGSLPEALEPAMVITVQPPGVRFVPPAPISFPNLDGLAAGSIVNIWGLDHASGQFIVVAIGQVSGDGSTIETIAGGVIESSWYLTAPAAPGADGGPNGGSVSSRRRDCEDEVGSTASVRDGNLGLEHELPAYITQNVRRAPRLVYNSLHADPRPVVLSDVTIPAGAAVPEAISARLRVGGVEVGARLFNDTSAVTGTERTLRHGVQFDAGAFATGLYPYSLLVTSHYPFSQISATQAGEVLVVNRVESPWGAGWGLDGVDALVPLGGGAMMLVEGDGSTVRFGPIGAGALEFDAPATHGDDLAFYDVQVVDLDGDDHLDLIGADFVNHQAGIFWGDGTAAGFSAPDLLPITTTQAVHTAAADLNGDGRLDLAVTNFNSFGNDGSFDVFLADGDRSFAAAVNHATGDQPIEIHARDMDGDDVLDLVVASQGDFVIYVHPGDGDGNFGTPIVAPSNMTSPRAMCIEDLNGDDRLDVATVGLNGRVSTFIGIGGGNLVRLGATDAVGSQVYALACGDLNGDGDLDIATANRNSNDTTVLFGDGAGGFVEQARLRAGLFPHGVAIADANGDGALDVVVASDDPATDGPGRLAIYLNRGNGILDAPRSFDTASDDTTGVRVADVNEDGVPDLVASSFHQFSSNAGLSVLTQLANVLGTVDAPPGDFSILFDNGDGTHTRRATDGTTWDFDAAGRLTAVTDRNGNATTYAYDGAGLLASITDPVGRATTFAFAGGLLDEITDPVGRRTSFMHDDDGNLERITDPDGTTVQLSYDERHRPTRRIDKRSQSTFYSYDFAGKISRIDRPDGSTVRLVSEQTASLVDPFGAEGTPGSPAPGVPPEDAAARIVDGRGNTTTFATNAFGDLTGAVDPLARTRDLERDLDGNPVETTDEGGNTNAYAYDEDGNRTSFAHAGFGTTRFAYDPEFAVVTEETDSLGRKITYAYDAAGNLLTRTDPDGRTRTYTYDASGQRTSQTDEFGNTTTIEYDARGNLMRVTNPLGDAIEFARSDAGLVTQVTEGAGTPEERVSTLAYDAMNRPIDQTFGNGATSTFGYDADGHVTSVQVASGETATLSYDPFGRFATVNHPLRGEMSYEYDEAGNIAAITDGGGDRTAYVYDASNRMTETRWPDGGVETYEYTPPGDLAEVRDPLDQATSFDYDGRGRQTARTDPLGNLRQFSYNTLDQMTFTAVPTEGQQVSFTYDNRGRITRGASRRDATTSDRDLNFTYDQAGTLTRVENFDSDLRFTYDTLNRLVSVETVDRGHQPATTITYTYDAVGNRAMLAATPGGTTTYLYDGAGRTTRIAPPFGGAIDMGYDPIGRTASIDFPNGVATDFVYDAEGRLEQIAHAMGATPIATFDYTSDDEGYFASMTDDAGARAFTYDARDRLVGAGTVASPETYAYDLAGNRTASHLSATYLYDAANRLVEDDGFTYDYDADGKLVSKTAKGSGVVTLFTYNGRNQLVAIDSTAGDAIDYVYDGLGRRIEKTANGSVTRYVYDGENILLEFDGSNNLVARYAHGIDVDHLVAMERGGMSYYFQTDHLGSVRRITDAAGAVVSSYAYDAFGRTISETEGVAQPFRFTAREWDAESGLYHLRRRAYDPAAGRFVAPDPLHFGAGDVNLYAYVGSNPVNFRDPMGTEKIDMWFWDTHNEGWSWYTQFGFLRSGTREFTSIEDLVLKVELAVGAPVDKKGKCGNCLRGLKISSHGSTGGAYIAFSDPNDIAVGTGNGYTFTGNVQTQLVRLRRFLCEDAIITFGICEAGRGKAGERLLTGIALTTGARVTAPEGQITNAVGGGTFTTWKTIDPRPLPSSSIAPITASTYPGR